MLYQLRNYSNYSKPRYTIGLMEERDTRWITAFIVPLYPDNERRSRATRVKPIKRFFRTYLCRSREGEDSPLYAGQPHSRYRRIHLYLLRDPLLAHLRFHFLSEVLCILLSTAVVLAQASIKGTQFVTFILLTLYILEHSGVSPLL